MRKTQIQIAENLKSLYPRLQYVANSKGQIQIINLKGSKIETIPEEIYSFYSLIELDLSVNKLTEISEKITQLQNLEILYLHHNLLQDIDILIKLSKLKKLTLSFNELIKIPLELFEKIPELFEESINHNYFLIEPKIGIVPHGITGILDYLHRKRNLNNSILEIETIYNISIDNKKLEGIPFHFLKNGNDGILTYYYLPQDIKTLEKLSEIKPMFKFIQTDLEHIANENRDSFVIEKVNLNKIREKELLGSILYKIVKENFLATDLNSIEYDTSYCKSDVTVIALFLKLNEMRKRSTNLISNMHLLELPNLLFDLKKLKLLIISGDKDNKKNFMKSEMSIGNIERIKEFIDLEDLRINNGSLYQISFLKQNFNLIKLDLHKNRIRDIEDIKFLQELKYLKISDNQIENIDAIQNLQKLEIIIANDNKIANINSFSKLKNIQQLNLSQNNITDISAISSLTNLKYVDISNNNINDLTPLSNLNKLKFLSLRNNKNIQNFTSISNLRKLEILDLSFTQFDNTLVLNQLPNLKEVRLNGTKISDLNFLYNRNNDFNSCASLK